MRFTSQIRVGAWELLSLSSVIFFFYLVMSVGSGAGLNEVCNSGPHQRIHISHLLQILLYHNATKSGTQRGLSARGCMLLYSHTIPQAWFCCCGCLKPLFVCLLIHCEETVQFMQILPNFLISPVKSGINTVRLTLRFTGMCSELNLGQLWASYSSLF